MRDTDFPGNPQARACAPDKAKTETSAMVARVAAVVIALPTLGAIVAGLRLAAGLGSSFEVGLLVSAYGVTLVGVEVGFHRMVAHRSFSAVRPVRVLLAVLGSMTAEGPLLWWVATHRRHHERSDLPGDPHSPHVRGERTLRGWRGFVHAHVGWMWSMPAEVERGHYVRDVLRDPSLVFVDKTYPLWVVAGLVAPALAGYAWRGWEGAARGLLWGGFVRLFVVHHAMWCVASVCHLFGTRPYRTSNGDRSRNNVWLSMLTFGESWHNNHHAFPTSARHGLEWWQLDLNYLVIRALAAVRLVHEVKVPAPAARRAKCACAKVS